MPPTKQVYHPLMWHNGRDWTDAVMELSSNNLPDKQDPTAGALHAIKFCEYQNNKPCVKQQRHVD
jgi:hypothetical protein